MREDKDAGQVIKEEKVSVQSASEKTQVREVGGHPLKFTNLSKVFWPREKISKRDMLNYYYQVAPYMAAYLYSAGGQIYL